MNSVAKLARKSHPVPASKKVNQLAECKSVESIAEFIDAIRLRVAVFIVEQNCEPGWEPDETDKIAKHFIASLDSRVVATTRCWKPVENEVKIERFVVDAKHRGFGIGRMLLNYVSSELEKERPARIWAQCQAHAQSFYERCGFTVEGPAYDHFGILHVDMRKSPSTGQSSLK